MQTRAIVGAVRYVRVTFFEFDELCFLMHRPSVRRFGCISGAGKPGGVALRSQSCDCSRRTGVCVHPAPSKFSGPRHAPAENRPMAELSRARSDYLHGVDSDVTFIAETISRNFVDPSNVPISAQMCPDLDFLPRVHSL